jgi:hypothetical protein
MIKYIIIVLSLISCSSVPKKKNWQQLDARPGYQIKSIPVVSRAEALKVIGNKLNFIKMIFEQSLDPYFGTPRWSEACLEINRLGEIVTTEKEIQSSSLLILNASGEPGYCNDRSDHVSTQVIYLYCEGDKHVLEIKFIHQGTNKKHEGMLCD